MQLTQGIALEHLVLVIREIVLQAPQNIFYTRPPLQDKEIQLTYLIHRQT